ncbi:PfkB family carbohydrate kinase [Nocardioides sambongensis]|uniref:PfkB family carbohydrate kinase n=1 Tax=Nocardioides sambongensis TaxID=2589074 RepID=UPI0015E86118|nr:PfkB family carbohydrate kinase [Nocardioides sambongensis]
MTHGADGATLARADGTSLAVAGARVEVADTIAAGDTFTAGLLDALIQRGAHGASAPAVIADLADDALAAAARHAVTAAGIAVSRPGADPPWRPELTEALLRAAGG